MCMRVRMRACVHVRMCVHVSCVCVRVHTRLRVASACVSACSFHRPCPPTESCCRFICMYMYTHTHVPHIPFFFPDSILLLLEFVSLSLSLSRSLSHFLSIHIFIYICAYNV